MAKIKIIRDSSIEVIEAKNLVGQNTIEFSAEEGESILMGIEFLGYYK